jgi:hypothetical protein
MSEAHHQPAAVPSSSDPVSTQDMGVGDAALLGGLRNELSTAQQGPDAYPSAWAAALGVPRDIQFGPTVPSPGGGAAVGYRVSPAQLQEWISELQVIQGWANDRDDAIRYIKESQPAAPDSVSGMANRAYVNSGQALQRSNEAIRKNIEQLTDKFKASLQAYENTEQSNRDAMRGTGEGH